MGISLSPSYWKIFDRIVELTEENDEFILLDQEAKRRTIQGFVQRFSFHPSIGRWWTHERSPISIVPSDEFDWTRYYRWLSEIIPDEECLFIASDDNNTRDWEIVQLHRKDFPRFYVSFPIEFEFYLGSINSDWIIMDSVEGVICTFGLHDITVIDGLTLHKNPK